MKTKKNPYQSGIYYKNIYQKNNRMDFKNAKLWMFNYYKAVKKIFPKINNLKNKRILEIGSGYGGFIDNLNTQGFKNVFASDMNKLIFDKKIKNNFLIVNLLDSELDKKITKKFDLIFAFDVMEHINKTEKAILNIKKLLKKNGFFVFCTPYPLKKHLLDKYHTNIQYPNYYSNLFHRNKFELIEIKNISFFPFIWRFNLFLIIPWIIKNRFFISETFFVFKKNGDEM